jgi:hypothetical protein
VEPAAGPAQGANEKLAVQGLGRTPTFLPGCDNPRYKAGQMPESGAVRPTDARTGRTSHPALQAAAQQPDERVEPRIQQASG